MARINGFIAHGVRFTIETPTDNYGSDDKKITINDHTLTLNELTEIMVEIKRELPEVFEHL